MEVTQLNYPTHTMFAEFILFIMLATAAVHSNPTNSHSNNHNEHMGSQSKTLSVGDQIQQDIAGDSTTGGFHVIEFHKGSTDIVIRIALIVALIALMYIWIRRRIKKAQEALSAARNAQPLMGEVARALTNLADQRSSNGPAYPMSVIPPRQENTEDFA